MYLRRLNNAALSMHRVMTQIQPCSSAQMVAPMAACPLRLITASSSVPAAVSKAAF